VCRRRGRDRYTGALKVLFLQAAEEVGDRTKIGPNGELDGNGGALAFLKVSAITERKTFFTVMARLLPITIKTAPPRNKGGRPVGSQNRYTGALKELFLLAAENVSDRLMTVKY
jgi:hypothetical protein